MGVWGSPRWFRLRSRRCRNRGGSVVLENGEQKDARDFEAAKEQCRIDNQLEIACNVLWIVRLPLALYGHHFFDIYLTQLQVQNFFFLRTFFFVFVFFIVANDKHNILSIFIDNINGLNSLSSQFIYRFIPIAYSIWYSSINESIDLHISNFSSSNFQRDSYLILIAHHT